MGVSEIVIQPVGAGNAEASVRFLIEWVVGDEADAHTYLADHLEPEGVSLVATCDRDVVGYVAILWESNFAGFRDRGIPLVRQVAVAGPTFPTAGEPAGEPAGASSPSAKGRGLPWTTT
jgi:hypothetical protein